MPVTSRNKIPISSEERSGITASGVFHSLIALLAWILFFVWWNQVIPQISVDDAAAAFLVIFLTVLLTSVLTLLWVRYNVGIFRRKGPRKQIPAVSEERDADYLGRSLDHPGYDLLKSGRIVLVSREGDKKKFEISRDA